VRVQAPRLVILIACGFFSLMAVGTAAQSPPSSAALRVVVPTGPVRVGQAFDVEVAIDDANDLGAFEVDILWDSDVVSLTGASLLTFLGAPESCDPTAVRCAVSLGPAYLGTDRARVGAYSYGTGAGPAGSGGLTRLHFMALTAGESPLTLSDPLVVDTQVNIITATVSGGSITVTNATPAATSTPTATPTASRTPTASPPASTPTPTPTSTSAPPWRLYIPVVRRGAG